MASPLNAFFILFTTLLIFSSCETPQVSSSGERHTVPKEDRPWMEKLFVDLMLEEGGIYTLWGSKPMTYISVTYTTQEQMDAFYESLSEESKTGMVIDNREYDLPENWEKWEKVRSLFPTHKYLLFIKHCPAVPEGPNFADVYFVNILESALLVEKHYNIFRKKIGHDFDPLDAVLEAENDDSEFWRLVKHDEVLFGLLCGFGEKNSLCFHWRHRAQSDISKDFTQTLDFRFSAEEQHVLPTLSNFIIPIFASYYKEREDPVIKKYEEERVKIQKIYKDRDFLGLTLEQLTSK